MYWFIDENPNIWLEFQCDIQGILGNSDRCRGHPVTGPGCEDVRVINHNGLSNTESPKMHCTRMHEHETVGS